MSHLFLFFLLVVPLPSFALCVSSPKANLRSGPGTHNAKSWKVYKYMPFKKIKKKGAWLKVKDIDGEYHWIHSKLVTSSYYCAVVKVKRANLRTGPGTNYRKPDYLPSVEKYSTFKLIKVKGQWAQLLDEIGDTAWIHRKLLWVQ